MRFEVLRRLEYADNMALMVDVFMHLGERSQKIADQSAELADLGPHFKKTNVVCIVKQSAKCHCHCLDDGFLRSPPLSLLAT